MRTNSFIPADQDLMAFMNAPNSGEKFEQLTPIRR